MPVKIALIADCDGTLAKDTTTVLVRELGADPPDFWNGVEALVHAGWDPPLAWTARLLKVAKSRRVVFDQSFLRRSAEKVEFYPGALDLKGVLNRYASAVSNEFSVDVNVELHVVTSGFEDLLGFTRLPGAVTEIWGGLLEFAPGDGQVEGPKSTVTFTEKTKFIFSINKGISKAALRSDPQRVNDLVSRNARPVPFRNMIYVGDGLTDIPCYSLIEQLGGAAVGVRKESTLEDGPESPHPRLWNYRPRWGPFHPEFTDGSDLTMLLKDLVHDAVGRETGRYRSS